MTKYDVDGQALSADEVLELFYVMFSHEIDTVFMLKDELFKTALDSVRSSELKFTKPELPEGSLI